MIQLPYQESHRILLAINLMYNSKMKKILILGFLFPVLLVQAQEFDESFLDSLPDDVKEDIMKRSDEQSKASRR